MNVRLGAHCGLKSDIKVLSKSAEVPTLEKCGATHGKISISAAM